MNLPIQYYNHQQVREEPTLCHEKAGSKRIIQPYIIILLTVTTFFEALPLIPFHSSPNSLSLFPSPYYPYPIPLISPASSSGVSNIRPAGRHATHQAIFCGPQCCDGNCLSLPQPLSSFLMDAEGLRKGQGSHTHRISFTLPMRCSSPYPIISLCPFLAPPLPSSFACWPSTGHMGCSMLQCSGQACAGGADAGTERCCSQARGRCCCCCGCQGGKLVPLPPCRIPLRLQTSHWGW